MSAQSVRLRAELKLRRGRVKRARAGIKAHQKRIGKIVAWLKAHPDARPVPGIDHGWHVKAKRVQVQAGGSYVATNHPRLTWHTTEGSSLPNYSGSHPHFTLDVQRRILYQHIPIGRSALALKNEPGGVETNRINTNIQVELIAYSDTDKAHEHGHPEFAVVALDDADYLYIAELARWIEKHAKVPRKCTVTFRGRDDVKRIGMAEWRTYEGHIGHQHIPEQDHWDPSVFKIGKVI